MVLLLLLNGVQHVADALVAKLEDAGVIERGRVLFAGQQIGAEVAVVALLRRFGGVALSEAGRDAAARGADLRYPALADLVKVA